MSDDSMSYKGLTFEKILALFRETQKSFREMQTTYDAIFEREAEERRKFYEEQRKISEELRKSHEELRKSYEKQRKIDEEQRKIKEEEQQKSYQEQRKSHEELRKIFEEQRKSYEEQRKSYEEQRKFDEEQRKIKEEERKIEEEERRKSYEEQLKLYEEQRKIKEEERKAEEKAYREYQKKLDEKFEKNFAHAFEIVGGLGNRFGELAEHLVAPGIVKQFRKLGYHFMNVASEDYLFKMNGKIVAEADILLENTKTIAVVEIKAKPRIRDIKTHLERMEIIRQYYETQQNKHHKILIGAIAGAIFPEDVKKFTIESGFYVITQSGDTVKIEVPKNFEPRKF
ncbi:MAG: hypothetical protein LBU34_15260 [Planctomycetaceae bacterium]|jgi:DNA repair exonuclease SbcCD ATPase subunit|nr:hypothetical protein [Planctomycetaceae bacterium]